MQIRPPLPRPARTKALEMTEATPPVVLTTALLARALDTK